MVKSFFAPYLITSFLCFVFSVLDTAHSDPPIATKITPSKVVTTTTMIADTIRAIGGANVTVSALMGPSIDPHLYKPTRGDIAQMSSSDIIFVNGLLLEGKFEETFDRLQTGGKNVVYLGDFLPKSDLRSPPEFKNHYDPHIWMAPSLWKKISKIMLTKLVELQPQAKKDLESRYQTFIQTLEKLDEYAKKTTSEIPRGSKVLVTAHDAFGYFGHFYNLQVLSIQGISTESEAGVREIEELVDFIVLHKIPAVFVESTVSTRNINALVEGCKSRGFSLKIGGELFSDGMGQSGTYLGTYPGMIDHNITTIGRALGANVPEQGLVGLLPKK
jgi:manganese/zinc/iron transport system substrate-binding protein